MSKSMNLALIVAAFGLLVFNAVFTINEGQQVIITQFGNPIGENLDTAGLYFKIPMIQKIHYFEKRILKWDGDPNEIPTKDKKFIWVDTTARWRISDPLLFFKRVNDTGQATLVLNDLINGAVRDFVTKNNLVEVVRSSDWNEEFTMTTENQVKEEVKIGRDQFSQLVLNNVSATTTSFGIELIDVLVKRINYTRDVRQKVYERMISERKRIAAKRRSEGEAKKSQILGEMDKRLKEISSGAYRKTQEIRGDADAEATKLYGESYGKDPEFYKFFISLQAYKKVLGPNTRLVIDSSSPLYEYLGK